MPRLDSSLETTVAELKERLGTAVSLSVANQRLFYGGLELQDGATVGGCGINAVSCDHATAQRCGQSIQRESAAAMDDIQVSKPGLLMLWRPDAVCEPAAAWP